MAGAVASMISRFERLAPRRMPQRASLLYALYTLVLFVIFLVLTFPHDLVARRYAQRIAEETGWEIAFEDTRLIPWDGYRFSNLRVLSPSASGQPWFGANRVSLRPSLRAWFGGSLTHAAFRGEAYGGRFSGRIELGSTAIVDLAWNDLHLDRYPRLAEIVEGEWGGRLSGELQLSLKQTLRDAEGRGKRSLNDGSLTGGNSQGFTVPDLTSTRGDVELELKAGRIDIRSAKLTGAELDADLRGQIYLRSPLSQSVVNATLGVKPIPGAPAGIEAILTLLARGQRPPGGAYSFTLYGILPRVKIR